MREGGEQSEDMNDVPNQPATIEDMIQILYVASNNPEAIQIIANPHRMTEMTLGEQKWRSAAEFFGSTVARLWSWDFDHYFFRVKPTCQCVLFVGPDLKRICGNPATVRIGATIWLCDEHAKWANRGTP